MSRHRNIKALNFDDELDEVYGYYDEDDDDYDYDAEIDVDGGAFEAKYLSSGIDLKVNESNSTCNVSKQRQEIIDEVRSKSSNDLKTTISEQIVDVASTNFKTTKDSGNSISCEQTILDSSRVNLSTDEVAPIDETITSNLTRLAISHLDKNQWQLPLMEMDKRFRDRTYYKHYTDTYISRLRSKLGHFLADNQLILNPMKYHVREELDNYSKYSRMLEVLTEYYQSLGGGFFSFATPSPDEEIVIGCRLGTKVKKPVSKQSPAPNKSEANQPKVARFEYQGKPTSNKKSQPSTSKGAKGNETKLKIEKQKPESNDITIREDHTAEQLDRLSKKYEESLKVNEAKNSNAKTSGTRATSKPENIASTKKATSKVASSSSQTKPLATLVEKRQQLKSHLKRLSEPTEKDREAFKKQALQTAKEYESFVRCSRPRINLVVVGHVDAGKSTLVGHLLYKLGQVSGKQMHRNEVDSQRSGKASFRFAWALDETNEERARGVTIDIALTKFETSTKDVVLLDAPGHVDFIPAVISGAAQADAALLVVDATRGEFETGFSSGGQTREHTFLVRSLGVRSLVVVVNKMDNVDWNWLRFHDIVEQLKPFLKQVGFNLNEDVQFVACSGLSGDNLADRKVDKNVKQSSHPQLEMNVDQWNSLPTLLEAIDRMRPVERMVDKPTRLCVTDVFKGMSSGVFLGGRVISGKIEGKQKLLLLPPNETCEIKQVEVRDSREQRAFAGDIVTTVATGVDINKYFRGCMLCDPLIPCHVTNRFKARIIMLDNADTILIKGSPIEIHINGTFESGVVRKLSSLLNRNTGELVQRKPRCVVKNSSAIIQLKLSRVVCCELYEDNKDLGRFMMRSYGKTIAAGLITKIKSAKLEKIRTKFKSK